MKNPKLGDIFYFSENLEIRYKNHKGIKNYDNITIINDTDFMYKFISGHKFEVIEVKNKSNFYIRNITTNDGLEFISRDIIVENLITIKKFRELQLNQLLTP